MRTRTHHWWARAAALCAAFAAIVPIQAQEDSKPSDDALDAALATVDLGRADLGWRPRGWWLRYPGDIPYKMRHFDDLLAEPLAVVSYTRTLAAAVRICLDPVPGKVDASSEGGLFGLVHWLGVHPRLGTFRGYSANLTAVDTPLDQALLSVQRAAGRSVRSYTFAMELPYPLPDKELAERAAVVPARLNPILGRLVLNVLDAQRWAELAFRNVPGAARLEASRRFNVGEEEVDAVDYAPAFDDVARTWDEASLWYAGLKCTQALDQARTALQAAMAEEPLAGSWVFDWETPYGWVHFRGSGDDELTTEGAWLIVDVGGNDRYRGSVAASSAERPIGLLLDLAGDDEYTALGPAQGAGICGIGLLVDVQGGDVYRAERYAQGVGQFGLGGCFDLEGDDQYHLRYSGQGCGYFGIGLLGDGAGRDAYRIYCDGQGLGGVAGVGVLADYSGSDEYSAERDAQVTKRPSYHSPGLNISVSNVQGCGIGRRGDGSDGHAWAGGLGALIDLSGDDSYRAGNWCMGTGYWFGTGLLYDGAGNDEYRGVCYSQGTGAHFCIGALIDEEGNDRHLAEENANASLAWGHDFTVSILLDSTGDDEYAVAGDGLSHSINRSMTLVLDLAGNDKYTTKAGNRPGMAVFDERLRQRAGVSTYFADTTALGLFLDVGGVDEYVGGGADGSTWLDPPDSPNPSVRNYSVGVDRPAGTVDFTPRPEKDPAR